MAINNSMSINHLLRPSRRTHTLSDGNQGTEVLRSYQHASRIFVDGNYRLSPKYGFLFYVEFDFNPLITSVSNTAAQELGMIVKSVGLPKFTIDTKVHNAYNRKNIVQNKISYDPINIVFHDDQADNVRNFWYDYYSYFYRDSDFADSTYGIIHKYQERPSFSWGYTPKPIGSYNSGSAYQNYQYIQAIRIYSLYQKNFSEYELVNPIITQFKHGEHQNGDNNLLQHEMVVQFETVKYQTGYTTENTVGGYIDLHYDTTPSPIAPTVGTDLVDDGQGGVTRVDSTITDLASLNLKTAGGSVVPSPSTGALSAYTTAATTAGSGTNLAANAIVNSGGFTLPYLGSITGAVSVGAVVNQQLNAAAVSLVASTGSTLAGSVVRGITSGLGSNGTALVGLATAAITNPSAVLKTVENMAVTFATGAVTAFVNNKAQEYGAKVSNEISKLVAEGKVTVMNFFDKQQADMMSANDPGSIVVTSTDASGRVTYDVVPSSAVEGTQTAMINDFASDLADQGFTQTEITERILGNFSVSDTEASQYASDAVYVQQNILIPTQSLNDEGIFTVTTSISVADSLGPNEVIVDSTNFNFNDGWGEG